MTTHSFLAVSDEALFIGPPRAQQRGEAHHARTLFPPPPTTFQGLVRTRLLLAGEIDLTTDDTVRKAVGPPETLLDGWRLDGPWVAGVRATAAGEETDVWVPLPRCVRVQRSSADARHRMSHLSLTTTTPRGETLLDDGTPPDLPVLGDEEPNEAWIGAETLLSLLRGGTTDVRLLSTPPFAARETRVGLSLDDSTRTAETGMLYFRETMRLAGGAGRRAGEPTWLRAGFLASLATPGPSGVPAGALSAGQASLGRRSRPLSLEVAPPAVSAWQDIVHAEHLASLPEETFRHEMEAWLVLASPASFPDATRDGTPTAPRLSVPHCQVEVRAAVLGRPIVLGGLELRKHTPKPNRAFVPAGSAWRVRLRCADAAGMRTALRFLHHACTVGAPSERPFGCGRTWITVPTEVSR